MWVAFDSSRHVLSGLGLAEDANDDYARFIAQMVMPLSRAGKTTAILDNTGHDGDHPRGASAKRDLNEVLFSLTAPDGDLDADVERRLVWRQTRGRFAGSIPRTLEQRIGGGIYGPPEPAAEEGEAGDQPFRPTRLMERVSQYVEFDDDCSQHAITEHVRGNDAALIQAIQVLASEGFIHREKRSGGWHQRSITAYREGEDPHA